jgi:DDB1- and CUL4-associated factor 11
MKRILCRILPGLLWLTIPRLYTVVNTVLIRPSTMSAAKVCLRTYYGKFGLDSDTIVLDFNLHIYDVSNPLSPYDEPVLAPYNGDNGHQTTMKIHKSIQGLCQGWTITDSHLSPHNDRMIYSSMVRFPFVLPTPNFLNSYTLQSSVVQMVKTMDDDSSYIPIDFSDRRRSESRFGWDYDDTCIWSCRFSADGNEVPWPLNTF